MSHGLLLWLENIDRRRNEIIPIDPTQDTDTLQEHHKTLLVNDFAFLFVQCLGYNLLCLFHLITDCLTDNPSGVAGHAVEGGVPAGHVSSAARSLGRQ